MISSFVELALTGLGASGRPEGGTVRTGHVTSSAGVGTSRLSTLTPEQIPFSSVAELWVCVGVGSLGTTRGLQHETPLHGGPGPPGL